MAGVADETKFKFLYDRGGLDAVAEELQSDFEISESAVIHIAVTGESGSGKSSFINALRGIDDGEEGATPTGETESTVEPTMYRYPNKVTFNILDLPGIGTPNFQASEYLERVNFDRYDIFIILSASRFTENDIYLATEIQQRKTTFYFVLSKIDRDLESAKHRENFQFNKKKTLQKLRNDCVENLKKEGIKSPQVFLISSWNLEKFDFGKLQEVLEEDRVALKRRVYLLSLHNITSSVIEKKKKDLLSDIWKLALLSAVVATVAALLPIPGLSIVCDVLLLVWKLSSYRTDFRLDDDSLGGLAKRVGKMTEELRSEVKSTFGVKLSASVILKELIMRAVFGNLGRFLVRFVPYIGDFLAAGISCTTTYDQLYVAVQDMAEDSKSVLAKAFKGMD